MAETHQHSLINTQSDSMATTQQDLLEILQAIKDLRHCLRDSKSFNETEAISAPFIENLANPAPITSPVLPRPPDPPDLDKSDPISAIKTAPGKIRASSLSNKLSRKYSCEEVYQRMESGLCLFCEELDTPGHYHLKHKRSQILMMEVDDDKFSGANELVEYVVEESMELEFPGAEVMVATYKAESMEGIVEISAREPTCVKHTSSLKVCDDTSLIDLSVETSSARLSPNGEDTLRSIDFGVEEITSNGVKDVKSTFNDVEMMHQIVLPADEKCYPNVAEAYGLDVKSLVFNEDEKPLNTTGHVNLLAEMIVSLKLVDGDVMTASETKSEKVSDDLYSDPDLGFMQDTLPLDALEFETVDGKQIARSIIPVTRRGLENSLEESVEQMVRKRRSMNKVSVVSIKSFNGVEPPISENGGSQEQHLTGSLIADRTFINGKLLSDFSLFTRVWEPGGLLIEEDKWKGLGKRESDDNHEFNKKLVRKITMTKNNLETKADFCSLDYLDFLDPVMALNMLHKVYRYLTKLKGNAGQHETDQTASCLWHCWKKKSDVSHAASDLIILGLIKHDHRAWDCRQQEKGKLLSHHNNSSALDPRVLQERDELFPNSDSFVESFEPLLQVYVALDQEDELSGFTEMNGLHGFVLAKRVWEPGGILIEHDEDDLDGLQVYVVRNRKLKAELEIYLCNSGSTLAEEFKVASTMRHNIRSYGVWHHRKRVLEEGNQPELRFLNKFQGLYFRNSHAWSCYKFIIELKLEVGVTAKLLVIFGVDWQRLIEWFGVHFHVNKSKDTVDFSRMSNDKKNGTVRDAESKRLRDIEAGYTSARNFHKTRTLYLGKVSEAKNSDKSFGAKELLQKFCWTVLVVILKMFSPLLTATSVNCVVLMDKLPSNSRVDDRQLITGKSINFYEILSQENLKAEVLEKILYNSRDFKFVLTSLLMTILLHIQLTLLVMGIRMTTDLATLIIQTQVQGEGYISSRRSPVYRFLLIGLYDSTLQNNITWKEKNLRMGKEPDFLVDTKMTTRQNKAVTKILKKGRNSFFGDDTVILAFTKETRVAGEFFLLNSGIFKNPRLLYGKENSLLVGFKVARELLVVYKQATMQPYVKHQWKSKKLHTDSGLGTKHPYNFAEFSTCQYVLRGCALIGDENYSTYSWLLQMRLNAASDQAHGVMIPVMISYKMPFQVKQRQQINKSCKSRMFKYKDMRQERYTLETQQHTLKIKLEQGRDYKEVQESAAVSETSEVCSSLLFLKRVATIAYLVFNLLRPPELRRAKWYGQTIYQVFSLSSLRTRMFSTREYCGRISSLVRFNGFKSRFSNFICVIRFDGSVYQTLLVTLFPIF